MLVETEVITYCNHRPVTEDLSIRSEHDLKTAAKIQVFIARSANKCMSPSKVFPFLESSRMIVNHACPWIIVGIDTDTSVNDS